jgi:lysophospholipase L1-like esterase
MPTSMTSPSTQAAALSYLALGDSYTIGEGIAADDAWPRQLAAQLRDAGIALADPHVIATTGWSSCELSAAIDAAAPGGHDFVSLLVGVNDQYRGLALAHYRSGFAQLLERATGLARGRADRVLVLSIPDWGVTPFGQASGRAPAQVAAELDAFNGAARAACATRDVAFVDITPVSRERGAEPAMLAADGLHPSAAMHALWTQLALPTAQRLLSR